MALNISDVWRTSPRPSGATHKRQFSGRTPRSANPGATATDRLRSGLEEAAAGLINITVEESLSRASAKVPLGRLAQSEKIANAVVFLAPPCASYVAGVILTMDGAAIPVVV